MPGGANATLLAPAPPLEAIAFEAAPVERRRRLVQRLWLRRILLIVLALWVIPNLAILGAHLTARAALGGPESYSGVGKFARLSDQVWRGANPSVDGYRQLAADGVSTVVELRAEAPGHLEAALAPLGLEVVRIPVRDGQAPTPEQVQEFLGVVQDAPGIVFVHCGAGVGRTGSMAAAELTARGVSATTALAENLAMGTPSLEQMFTTATAEDGEMRSAPAMITLASRVVDAPRRAFHVLGF